MNQYNYYPGYIPQMQPINNQNPNIINDYPYFSCQFPIYGFQQIVTPYYMEVPRSLQENLQDIYQRGIVNNIIGAFFIKEHQEKLKNNKKTKVPISLVELTDEEANNNHNTGGGDNNNNNYNNENNLGQHSFNFGDNNNNNNMNMNEITNIKEENKEKKEEKDNCVDKDKEKDKNFVEHQKEKEENEENININNNNSNHANELKKPDMVF